MRPVSARFLAAVSGSHRMVSRARVVPAGLNGTNPGGTEYAMDSGTVTLDSTAQVRGTVDITVLGSWATSATSDLTPYGNELFIERGVVYGDGTREWVSQGYYRIDQVEQQRAPFGEIQITGSDRMQGIVDARLPYPIQYNAGSTVFSVIYSLVADVYPWVVMDYDASLNTKTITTDQTTTDDRYGFLYDLVTAQGMIMYWDYRGYLYIHPPPNPAVTLATISSGQNGVLTTLSRTLNRDSVYNGCVASGEQMSSNVAPVTALVVDNNPTSPTYWYGAFGKVPQFYSSSFLATTAQCESAGQSIMVRSTGLPYNVDFGQVPNPALEPLDPISIEYPIHNSISHTRTEQHVISTLTIGLSASDEMTGTTRQLVNGVFS